MTVAVSKAVEEGARAVICASTGNTAASAAAYAARAGIPAVVLQPAGAVTLGKLAQARAVGARVLEVRGTFDEALTAARELGRRGDATCSSTRSTRTGSRARRPPRSRSSRSSAALPTPYSSPTAAAATRARYFYGFQELGRDAATAPRRSRRDRRRHRRVRDPDHRAGARAEVEEAVGLSDGRVADGHRRRDPRAWQPRARGGGLLRAVVRRGRRRHRAGRSRAVARRWSASSPATGSRIPRAPTAHAPRRRSRSTPTRTRSPRLRRETCTCARRPRSANLGPGFDCAAVALDLWNELEVTEGDGVVVEGEGEGELPEDESNLAVRAYALVAPPAGKRFRFLNRIPLERGLGSSAAAIALGLAAAGRPGTHTAARAARARAPAREPRGQPRRGADGRRLYHLGRPHHEDRHDTAAHAGRTDPAGPGLDDGGAHALPPQISPTRTAPSPQRTRCSSAPARGGERRLAGAGARRPAPRAVPAVGRCSTRSAPACRRAPPGRRSPARGRPFSSGQATRRPAAPQLTRALSRPSCSALRVAERGAL